MGKGDRRSKRGKIWRGTTGKRRPKNPVGAKPGEVTPQTKPSAKPGKTAK